MQNGMELNGMNFRGLQGGKKVKTREFICAEANYIIDHNATVRQTGEFFGRSKSAVHHDMREKLPYINGSLAKEVAKVLQFNLVDRAHRGGASTKARWQRIKGGKQ